MQEIIFDCEITTPMFLAGADGKTPEIRPPTIKAALRFWWRAMNGHLGIQKMKQKEAEFFGGSGDNEGRSKFSIRMNNQSLSAQQSNFPRHMQQTTTRGRSIQFNIIDYLAFGAVAGGNMLRGYFPTGGKFSFSILLKDSDAQFINEIKDLIFCISVFGGLGAKSRNGFGRFIVTNEPKELKDLNAFVSTKMNVQNDPLNFTAFSKDRKFFQLKDAENNLQKFDQWDECLASLGKVYFKGIYNKYLFLYPDFVILN